MKTPSNNVIALVCLILGTGLAIYIFSASRNDPGLRMAALVAATGTVASLTAIASTMLTGKDLTKKDEPTESTSVTKSVLVESTANPPTLPETPADPTPAPTAGQKDKA